MNTTPVASKFHSHAGRSCCRCRKDLTDMASVEAGIGPICRKQDNVLLANSIPANPPEALMALMTINADASINPDAQALYADVLGMLTLNLDGTDWRIAIRKIEQILSFDDTRWETLNAFSEVARWLGYLGLAALWNGEAATGDATVTFNAFSPSGPRVFIDGPRCMAARNKFYKEKLYPVNVPSPTPGRRMIGVHAKDIDAFATIVQTHYPMAVGMTQVRAEVDAFLAAIKAASTPAPTPVTVQGPPTAGAPVSSSCRIEKKGKNLKVSTPYDASFIAGLKNMVPYTHRGWDATTKTWMVDAQYLDKVSDLILQCYKKQPTIIDVDAVQTDISSVLKHVDNAQTLADAAAKAKAAAKEQAKVAAAVKQAMVASHTPVASVPQAPSKPHPPAPAPYVPEKPSVLPF